MDALALELPSSLRLTAEPRRGGARVLEVDPARSRFVTLPAEADGGYAVDAATAGRLYVGPAARRFLATSRGFERQTAIIVPDGSAVRLTVETKGAGRARYVLDEPGVVLVNNPEARVDVVPEGDVVVATASVPAWYEPYGPQGPFSTLFQEMRRRYAPDEPRGGYNRTGLVWPEGWEAGVAVHVLRKRRDLWSRAPSEWLLDSTSDGGPHGAPPVVGISRVASGARRVLDFARELRRAEKVHRHPSLEDMQMTEVYVITKGKAGLLMVKDGAPYLCVVEAGDVAIIRPDAVHAMLAVEGPYEHFALQFPSTFQYGFWFKKDSEQDQPLTEEPWLMKAAAAALRSGTGILALSGERSVPVALQRAAGEGRGLAATLARPAAKLERALLPSVARLLGLPSEPEAHRRWMAAHPRAWRGLALVSALPAAWGALAALPPALLGVEGLPLGILPAALAGLHGLRLSQPWQGVSDARRAGYVLQERLLRPLGLPCPLPAPPAPDGVPVHGRLRVEYVPREELLRRAQAPEPGCAIHPQRGTCFELLRIQHPERPDVLLVANAEGTAAPFDRDWVWQERRELDVWLFGQGVSGEPLPRKESIFLRVLDRAHKARLGVRTSTEVLRTLFSTTQAGLERGVAALLSGEASYVPERYARGGAGEDGYRHTAHFSWLYATQVRHLRELLAAEPGRRLTVVDDGTGAGHFPLVCSAVLTEEERSRVRFIATDYKLKDMRFGVELAGARPSLEVQWQLQNVDSEDHDERLRRWNGGALADLIVANHVLERLESQPQVDYVLRWLRAGKRVLVSVPFHDLLSSCAARYDVRALRALGREVKKVLGARVWVDERDIEGGMLMFERREPGAYRVDRQHGHAALAPRPDGGFAFDAETESVAYWGEAAREYLRSGTSFPGQLQVLVPRGAKATVRTAAGEHVLDEPGAVLVNDADAKVELAAQGDVLVLHSRRAPEGFEAYGPSGRFGALFAQKGYNPTGIVWRDGGVLVFSLAQRRASWQRDAVTDWYTDSMTEGGPYGPPLLGGSRLALADLMGPFDFTEARPEEKPHLHPTSMGELYVVTRGRMGLLVLEGERLELLVLHRGDMAVVGTGVTHAIYVASGPYEHLVVQAPARFHYPYEEAKWEYRFSDYAPLRDGAERVLAAALEAMRGQAPGRFRFDGEAFVPEGESRQECVQAGGSLFLLPLPGKKGT